MSLLFVGAESVCLLLPSIIVVPPVFCKHNYVFLRQKNKVFQRRQHARYVIAMVAFAASHEFIELTELMILRKKILTFEVLSSLLKV
jgi:hypothetical protein